MNPTWQIQLSLLSVTMAVPKKRKRPAANSSKPNQLQLNRYPGPRIFAFTDFSFPTKLDTPSQVLVPGGLQATQVDAQ